MLNVGVPILLGRLAQRGDREGPSEQTQRLRRRDPNGGNRVLPEALGQRLDVVGAPQPLQRARGGLPHQGRAREELLRDDIRPPRLPPEGRRVDGGGDDLRGGILHGRRQGAGHLPPSRHGAKSPERPGAHERLGIAEEGRELREAIRATGITLGEQGQGLAPDDRRVLRIPGHGQQRWLTALLTGHRLQPGQLHPQTGGGPQPPPGRLEQRKPLGPGHPPGGGLANQPVWIIQCLLQLPLGQGPIHPQRGHRGAPLHGIARGELPLKPLDLLGVEGKQPVDAGCVVRRRRFQEHPPHGGLAPLGNGLQGRRHGGIGGGRAPLHGIEHPPGRRRPQKDGQMGERLLPDRGVLGVQLEFQGLPEGLSADPDLLGGHGPLVPGALKVLGGKTPGLGGDPDGREASGQLGLARRPRHPLRQSPGLGQAARLRRETQGGPAHPPPAVRERGAQGLARHGPDMSERHHPALGASLGDAGLTDRRPQRRILNVLLTRHPAVGGSRAPTRTSREQQEDEEGGTHGVTILVDSAHPLALRPCVFPAPGPYRSPFTVFSKRTAEGGDCIARYPSQGG
ncbi:alpha-2 type XI collagen [Stigmatella aurantiaca DW4/3-1]|uniref:Alpha-2 type XI collagen n=1 Tax=Stigmatella aurantiaca (strain DW4/3-1) TaxID=378806 RepID=Q091D8_STIAD|nr:alpha-2 type XI collagen [Stigmatella aurantiaca DW4/3-1]